MSELLEPPFTGADLAPPPAVFEAMCSGYLKGVAELKLSDEELVIRAWLSSLLPGTVEPIPSLVAYKANPAEGMWASPPFLHNGSVPNLYELLIPARERSKNFFVGREFDPVKVGVDTSGNSGKFLLDTSLVGNSNAGHSFEDGRARQRRHRPVADRRRTLGIGRVYEVDPERAAADRAFRRPGGPDPRVAGSDLLSTPNPGTYNGAPQLSEATGVGQQPRCASLTGLPDGFDGCAIALTSLPAAFAQDKVVPGCRAGACPRGGRA